MPFPSPCGVNIVANSGQSVICNEYLKKFPSPCGVNIVANQIGDGAAALSGALKFPSPCGVNIVANFLTDVRFGTSSIEFPSPCGVNIVANPKNKIIYRVKPLVSVPLRGKYRGEYLLPILLMLQKLPLFPSPCGVNIVANLTLSIR